MGAWTALPSTYAVEVLDELDIVAAVNFARNNNLRLVVKGTGKLCEHMATGHFMIMSITITKI